MKCTTGTDWNQDIPSAYLTQLVILACFGLWLSKDDVGDPRRRRGITVTWLPAEWWRLLVRLTLSPDALPNLTLVPPDNTRWRCTLESWSDWTDKTQTSKWDHISTKMLYFGCISNNKKMSLLNLFCRLIAVEHIFLNILSWVFIWFSLDLVKMKVLRMKVKPRNQFSDITKTQWVNILLNETTCK